MTPMRSILGTISNDKEEEIHFTSLEDTDNPELLYNSMKIESDAYNEHMKEMELCQTRENIFDFNMIDFPDDDNEMRGERSLRFKTPFN